MTRYEFFNGVLNRNGGEMRILSLFDGMSCGQIALLECGIEVENYFASEIDKFAIAQTMLNFPNTKQLGSVVDVSVEDLGWIDLLIGGSPCHSFSFTGKRKGMATKCEIEITTLEQYLDLKEQGFEFEGQSYLFWEYMRILVGLRKVNPNIKFLLENVEMGAKWEMILSRAIGIRGVHINSALVSAQNRKRIYWTNIRTVKAGFFEDEVADIPQPEDRGVLLRDVLEDEVDEKYYLSEKMLNYFDKRAANFNAGKVNVRDENDKATTLCASMASCDISDNFILDMPNKSFCIDANYHKGASVDQYLEKHRRQLVSDGLPLKIRRLTPTECARLQTVPSWYRWECSATQQYRMLGNGWTIEVIKHIFQHVK